MAVVDEHRSLTPRKRRLDECCPSSDIVPYKTLPNDMSDRFTQRSSHENEVYLCFVSFLSYVFCWVNIFTLSPLIEYFSNCKKVYLQQKMENNYRRMCELTE